MLQKTTKFLDIFFDEFYFRKLFFGSKGTSKLVFLSHFDGYFQGDDLTVYAQNRRPIKKACHLTFSCLMLNPDYQMSGKSKINHHNHSKIPTL